MNVVDEEMFKRCLWDFVFIVDSFLEDIKDGMLFEE